MAAASITSMKEEPCQSPIGLEERIVQLLNNHPEGMSDGELVNQLVGVDANQRLTAINRLLTSAKIDLLKSGTMLLYKLKDTSVLDKVKGASAEETTVYQIIEESGQKGIWIKEIRDQSHLSQAQLKKALKNLESRKLVKCVKSVGASRKKYYMLFELEPDCSLTGGSFYSDQEFDSQFADLLIDQCRNYLEGRQQMAKQKFAHDPIASRKAALVDSNEVWKHICDLKISKVDLTVADVDRLLETLVFDSSAEKVIVVGREKALFRSVRRMMPPSGLTQIPCTFCPVQSDCQPGSSISPETCIYFKDWLAQT